MEQATGYQPYDPNFGMPDPQQKSWFGRNWFWFVPLLIILPFLCCCGCCGGMFFFMLNKFQNMEPYLQSIELVQNNDEITDELGTPIDVVDFVEFFQEGGSINGATSNTTATFEMSLPMSGPNGTGTLTVVAESSDGGETWTYTTREFQIHSSGRVIDLLEEEDAVDDTDAEDGDAASGDEAAEESGGLEPR